MQDTIQTRLVALSLSVLLSFACGSYCSAAKAADTTAVQKQTFAVRHPVMHRRWRKARRFCQATLPVVQWAGSAMQIATFFRI